MAKFLIENGAPVSQSIRAAVLEEHDGWFDMLREYLQYEALNNSYRGAICGATDTYHYLRDKYERIMGPAARAELIPLEESDFFEFNSDIFCNSAQD